MLNVLVLQGHHVESSQAVLVAPPPPLPLLHRKALVSPEEKSTPMINPEEPVVDTPSMVPDTLDTPIKSKIPLPAPTPSEAAHHRPQPRRRSWIHRLLLLNAESFEKGGLLWWQHYIVTRNGCLISYADSKRQL